MVLNKIYVLSRLVLIGATLSAPLSQAGVPVKVDLSTFLDPHARYTNYFWGYRLGAAIAVSRTAEHVFQMLDCTDLQTNLRVYDKESKGDEFVAVDPWDDSKLLDKKGALDSRWGGGTLSIQAVCPQPYRIQIGSSPTHPALVNSGLGSRDGFYLNERRLDNSRETDLFFKDIFFRSENGKPELRWSYDHSPVTRESLFGWREFFLSTDSNRWGSVAIGPISAYSKDESHSANRYVSFSRTAAIGAETLLKRLFQQIGCEFRVHREAIEFGRGLELDLHRIAAIYRCPSDEVLPHLVLSLKDGNLVMDQESMLFVSRKARRKMIAPSDLENPLKWGGSSEQLVDLKSITELLSQ